MKLYLPILAILLLEANGATNNNAIKAQFARDIKIVNGEYANDGEFPFQVSLQYNGGHYCGATILNSQWILTAAHCIHGNNIYDYQVRAGSNSASYGGSLHSVTGGGHHEYYQHSYPYPNDVAVLQVNPPFSFNDGLSTTSLPSYGQDVPGGYPSTAVGWGSSCDQCGTNPYLMKVDLVIYSLTDCQNIYGYDGPSNNNVCSGNPQEGKGICFGDSGGPLLVGGVQVGITSWTGTPCASVPAVWTKVSSYRDWITSQTGA